MKITTNILPEGRKGREKKKTTKHKQTWYEQMQVSKDSKIKKKKENNPKKHVAIQLNKCCL